ncbi:MAG TPA: arginase family protein [Pilimelia sp.]|nr:arginase family protein [Pilimelia sp.]
MTRVAVPYHLDEYLPDLDLPVDVDTRVTAQLPDGDPWGRMVCLYDQVAVTVAGIVRRGGRPTVLSGDCTTSLGVVAGLQLAGLDPAIVWFDGHGDVQTLETTTSGYLGGMPLRMLVGYRPELMARPLGLRPVAERRVALVDARDLDPPEREYLARSEIRRLPVGDVSADTLPDGPIYLHLDTDVIDPADLPGLRFPAPGGPGLAAVAAALHRVGDTGRVAALGLACTWWAGHGAAAVVRPHVEDFLNRWSDAV